VIDLSIVNAQVVTEDLVQPLDIHVAGGRIVALSEPGQDQPDAAEVIDAAGLHVLPGVVEPHAHIGLGDGDDWQTETASAARGGVTTVFNYVMGSASYYDQVKAEHELAGPRTHVDYGLHVVPCTEQHLAELDGYVRDLGVNSFKYFMSFRGDEGKYLGISGTDDGFLTEYLQKVAAHPGAVANIHAENIEVVWRLRKELMASGEDSFRAWNDSRPGFVEAEAAARAAFFGRLYGATVYIVHTSAAMTVQEAARARAAIPPGSPARLLLETCAHYLTHTQDAAEGMIAKANPPLRTQQDADGLWAAIASGEIQTVGSDHSPRHRSKKTGTVWQSPAGVSGIGVQLTVLLSEGYHQRGIPLTTISKLTATNPARIFGVYPRKGAIRVGSDADLTLVDLDAARVVGPDSFGGRAEYNLYEGRTLTGWPVRTCLRGQWSFADGAVVSPPGSGRYLPRHPASPATSSHQTAE
jgi:dihydropyrimidinase